MQWATGSAPSFSTSGEVLEGGGWEITFCPRRRLPSTSSAPSVILPSVLMDGITSEPNGSLATLEKRKMAASSDRKKVRAPAKKKLPAGPYHQNRNTCGEVRSEQRYAGPPACMSS